jgi:hypothetical protein
LTIDIASEPQLHDKIHHIRAEWQARCVINVAGTATDSLITYSTSNPLHAHLEQGRFAGPNASSASGAAIYDSEER